MTQAKSSSLLDLLVTIIVPSVILMKLSDPESLGAINALLVALAFPLSWGARSLLRERRVNPFAALGLVSVLLTGGIGLLQLDTQWLAVKEAAIPGLIGLAVAISAYTRNPLVRVILFSPAHMDVERIKQALDERDRPLEPVVADEAHDRPHGVEHAVEHPVRGLHQAGAADGPAA